MECIWAHNHPCSIMRPLLSISTCLGMHLHSHLPPAHAHIPQSVCIFFLFLSLTSFHTQMLDCLNHTFHISFSHKHHELQSVIQWSCTTNHTFIGILISWMILALTTFIKYLTSEHMMKDLEEDLQTPPPFCNSVSLIRLPSVLNSHRARDNALEISLYASLLSWIL